MKTSLESRITHAAEQDALATFTEHSDLRILEVRALARIADSLSIIATHLEKETP